MKRVIPKGKTNQLNIEFYLMEWYANLRVWVLKNFPGGVHLSSMQRIFLIAQSPCICIWKIEQIRMTLVTQPSVQLQKIWSYLAESFSEQLLTLNSLDILSRSRDGEKMVVKAAYCLQWSRQKIYQATKGTVCFLGGIWYVTSWLMQWRTHSKKFIYQQKKNK